MNQRTISRKVVQQCRERISFSITTKEPVKPQKQTMTSLGSLPLAPDTVPQRSTGPKLWVAVGAALLLVCGAGAYFTAPEWKARARKWIQQVGKSGEEPTSALVERPRVANGANGTEKPSAETANAMVDDQSLTSTDMPEIPLRMPQPPPEFDPGQMFEPGPPSLSGPDQHPSAAISSVDDGTAVPPRPDPADAVEWLLKKRQRGKNK
jgi:hypothetical protein